MHRKDLSAAKGLPCPEDTLRLVRYGSCPERIMIDVGVGRGRGGGPAVPAAAAAGALTAAMCVCMSVCV